jgi:nucleotide-binding universal stress UspA family protein
MIDLHRILVPTDFGKSSENALTYALAFAQKFGARVWLLHVVQDVTLFIPEAVFTTPPPVPPVEQFIAAARAALERAVKGLKVDGVTVQPEVGVGPPADEIVRYAKGNAIDLIVMGTHGHTGLAHVVLGSVAEKVVRMAPCPVLVVRDSEREFVHPDPA